MRTRWFVCGAALTLALAGSTSAQVPVNFNLGVKPATSTVNVQSMLPKVNADRALMTGSPSSRRFDFSRLLPNLSFMEDRGNTRRGYSEIDPKYFGILGKQPKKK